MYYGAQPLGVCIYKKVLGTINWVKFTWNKKKWETSSVHGLLCIVLPKCMGRVLYLHRRLFHSHLTVRFVSNSFFFVQLTFTFVYFLCWLHLFPLCPFIPCFFFFCAEEVFTTFCVPFWRFIKDVLFFIFIPWYCFTGFTVFILLFFFFSTLRRCRSKKFNRCQPKPVHLLFNIRTPYYYTKDILYKTWWIMFSFIFFWPVAL